MHTVYILLAFSDPKWVGYFETVLLVLSLREVKVAFVLNSFLFCSFFLSFLIKKIEK